MVNIGKSKHEKEEQYRNNKKKKSVLKRVRPNVRKHNDFPCGEIDKIPIDRFIIYIYSTRGCLLFFFWDVSLE